MSIPENVNVIDVDLVLPSFATALLLPSTAESILAVEGTVSMVQLNEVGDETLFPTLSSALICNV